MPGPLSPLRRPAALLAVAALGLVASCGTATQPGADRPLKVVTTTGIIADLVRNVGGDRVEVSSLVPPGADPHTYEPSPSDARRVAEADVTFTNHLLLEPQALVTAIDANSRDDAANVSLAESSETYGAHVIPLVENLGLDVLWLGLRVRGEGHALGADRTSQIRIAATDVKGPGRFAGYLTESLGAPEIFFDSGDGLDDRDATTVPPAAHTHLNWAFTKPGVYKVTLASQLRNQGAPPKELGKQTFTFAVGVDPAKAVPGATVLNRGHADLATDLDKGGLYAFADAEGGTKQTVVPADKAVIEVPARAAETVPDDPQFGFLGAPGARILQLPQAVLGQHVHGEIDPHLWQDVHNADAYAQVIRDTLSRTDPDGASYYSDRTRAYGTQLDDLDRYVRDRVATIPADRRRLVTTHDAFGYFADAYGLTVGGFVVPNPAQEPSVDDVRKLSTTIHDLHVPAVFLESNLIQRASVLRQVASDQGARICTVYGDAFDDHVQTYADMMRHNADEITRCLGGAAR
ncbi:anchored repeat ABC transporter, substrate-binding protein [Pseudonocardia phyllosphaerae]|uniref:anchored repeat ABC transporter, substrate-binding protein n=1 Tax=Pseudonocardia phyllosphaerae TaxID=3390502 RepID=UPI00397D2BF3